MNGQNTQKYYEVIRFWYYDLIKNFKRKDWLCGEAKCQKLLI